MRVVDKIKKLFSKIFPTKEITSSLLAIGVTVFDREGTFIKMKLKYKKGFDIFVFAHEIGHIVDDKYRYTHDAEDFADTFATIYIMELIEKYAEINDIEIDKILEYLSNYPYSIFDTRYLYHAIDNIGNAEIFSYAKQKLRENRGVVDILMLLFTYTYIDMLLNNETEHMTTEELYEKANEMVDKILTENDDILTIKINDKIKYDIDIYDLASPVIKAFHELERIVVKRNDNIWKGGDRLNKD